MFFLHVQIFFHPQIFLPSDDCWLFQCYIFERSFFSFYTLPFLNFFLQVKCSWLLQNIFFGLLWWRRLLRPLIVSWSTKPIHCCCVINHSLACCTGLRSSCIEQVSIWSLELYPITSSLWYLPSFYLKATCESWIYQQLKSTVEDFCSFTITYRSKCLIPLRGRKKEVWAQPDSSGDSPKPLEACYRSIFSLPPEK